MLGHPSSVRCCQQHRTMAPRAQALLWPVMLEHISHICRYQGPEPLQSACSAVTSRGSAPQCTEWIPSTARRQSCPQPAHISSALRQGCPTFISSEAGPISLKQLGGRASPPCISLEVGLRPPASAWRQGFPPFSSARQQGCPPLISSEAGLPPLHQLPAEASPWTCQAAQTPVRAPRAGSARTPS